MQQKNNHVHVLTSQWSGSALFLPSATTKTPATEVTDIT